MAGVKAGFQSGKVSKGQRFKVSKCKGLEFSTAIIEAFLVPYIGILFLWPYGSLQPFGRGLQIEL